MNKNLPPTSIDVDRKLVDGLWVCVCVCVCVREASCIILHPFSRTAFRLIPFPRRIVEEKVHNSSSSSQRLIDRVQGSRITLLVFCRLLDYHHHSSVGSQSKQPNSVCV